MALAIDHRAQLEALADRHGAPRSRIDQFKVLASMPRCAWRRTPGFGMLLDSTYGQKALYKAAKAGLWLARPVEKPGSRPLDLEPFNLFARRTRSEMPVLLPSGRRRRAQGAPGARARARAPRRAQRGRELLIEIIAGKHGALADDTVARVLERLYALGIKPDWWKLEPQKTPARGKPSNRSCRPTTLLPRHRQRFTEAPAQRASPRSGLRARLGRSAVFAGRTIFADAADQWLSGKMTDDGRGRRHGRPVREPCFDMDGDPECPGFT